MLADGIVHGTSRLDLGGRRERRGCLFADIEVDGVRFGFGLTHLSLHRATRTRQLVALAERVPAHEPFILVGDFNCSRAELAPLDEVLTFIDTPPRTFPSPYPLRALDHIGYSRHWELRSVRAVPTLASDHLPLVAELVRTGP